MKLRLGCLALFGIAMVVVPALGQSNPLRGQPPSGGTAAAPDQPVQPQTPVLVPRIRQIPAEPPAPQPPQTQPLPAPFTLTPPEEAQVDQVLRQWEQRNKKVTSFDCSFRRWIYDSVFNPPEPGKDATPKFTEDGIIKYAAPDRGLFQVEQSIQNGKAAPIDDSRADHWMCDGKAIYEYSPTKKQVIEHKLPPELQGKAIANTPLPFLFSAEAKQLKERYYIRIATPANVKDQIWLEAYPRDQKVAAEWHHALFIVKTEDMTPYYLKLVQPNQKDWTSYQFFNVVENDPLKFWKFNPFRPYTPLGWQLVPDSAAQPPASQARRPAEGGRK